MELACVYQWCQIYHQNNKFIRKKLFILLIKKIVKLMWYFKKELPNWFIKVYLFLFFFYSFLYRWHLPGRYYHSVDSSSILIIISALLFLRKYRLLIMNLKRKLQCLQNRECGGYLLTILAYNWLGKVLKI